MSAEVAPPTQPDFVAPAEPMAERRLTGMTLVRRIRGFLHHGLNACGAVIFLSALSAIPIANVYVLGYLLESEGRIANGFRWRDAIPSARTMRRGASLVVGLILFTFPLRLLADFAADAVLIDPDGIVAQRLTGVTVVLSWIVLLYLLLAVGLGAKPARFFNPIGTLLRGWREIRRGRFVRRASLRMSGFLAALRLRSRFWLGLRGVFVAWVIFAVPALLLMIDTPQPGPMAVGRFLGAMALAITLMIQPLAQARFAARNRWRAAFHITSLWGLFRRAPWSVLLAAIAALLLALPISLLSIVHVPADVAWIVAPLFVVVAWPARLAAGAAYAVADKRELPGSVWWTVSGIVLFVPIIFLGVGLLFLVQFVNADGRLALFELNSLLLPLPRTR
ncbi:hypothetical protein [Stratiformator vulcanicus]|uniref:DUF4013 domain-containing protein n=1 Tax=Stratiformator vulcanicus TaxID=2527980 RepID=A0A517R2S1_9PLAN|nr:hypothetical protein [Stratiformator vulcanicus]QDT38154.1 hypothetical protein Pan189_25440 [Stratiformator vulcanicus]